MATQLSYAACNVKSAAFGATLNSGYLRFYSGTPPANADTALSGNTLLAEARFASTAFGSPNNGAVTAAAIAQVVGLAAGTPAFYRAFDSDGTTVRSQGLCGVSGSGAECILAAATIAVDQPVQVTSFVHTEVRQ